ncbi:8695_t:CDS:2, partial [Scutellospora calospora]
DFQSNFRRPIMYSDNEGSEKGKEENLKENQNFLVDKEFKKIIKAHRWFKKEVDIVDENEQYFVNHMFLDVEISSENLREKYINVLKENSEYLQRNINLLNINNALKKDKDDLIKENKELKEQIKTEMDKLNKEMEKIKKTNDALKVLLQEMQDEN